MNRIGRLTIVSMLLITLLAIFWNTLGRTLTVAAGRSVAGTFSSARELIAYVPASEVLRNFVRSLWRRYPLRAANADGQFRPGHLERTGRA